MKRNDIIRFRATHNLSQTELAELAGVTSYKHISNYERGATFLDVKFRDKMQTLIDEFGISADIPEDLEVYYKHSYKRNDHNGRKKRNKEVEEVAIIDGVSPDQPVVYNEKGGGQSATPYRMDLIDAQVILDVAKVLAEGAEKYGENNWHNIPINDHLNHLIVHVYAYLAGDRSDEHLSHAICRAIFALGVEKKQGES